MKRFFLLTSLLCLFSAFSLPQKTTAQGLITGQITDIKGEPLPGAHVEIPAEGKVSIANEKGVYRIEKLEPGTYELLFSYVGYQTEKRTTRVVEGTAKTILHVQMQEQIISLNALEVRALRPSQEAPFTSETLNKKQLSKADNGRDIPYLLQDLPSVLVTSDAGAGIGYTDLRIRGIDATRINVTINGIPLNDAESQKVYWVDLPDLVGSLQDLQIQRGVGASTNGPAAFGASLNLNTLQNNVQPSALIRSSAGSFNTLHTAVNFQTGLLGPRAKNKKEPQGFFFGSRLSRIQSDGYIDRASARLRSYYAEAGYQSSLSELRLIAFGGHERTYQAWYGVPAEYLDDPQQRTYNPAGTEKSGEPYPDEVDDYTQQHFQALFKRRLNPNYYFNLAAHYTRGYGYYEQYKADEWMADYGLADSLFCPDGQCPTDLVRRRWLSNHFYGAVWALHYTSNSTSLRLIYSGATNRYIGDHFGEVIWAQRFGQSEKDLRYYQNNAQKSEVNNYLKLEYRPSLTWLFYLDAQSRYLNYQFEGKNSDGQAAPQEVSLHFFNPKAGFSWFINEQLRAYASVAVGHREPNRNDYVDSSPESRPHPEKLTDFELGFRQTGEKFQSGLTLYYMLYKDQLALTGQINDVGEYTRINIPQSFRRGLEAELRYRPLRSIQLSLNATLSDNRIKNFTEYIDAYSDAGEFSQIRVEHENTPLAFSPAFLAKGSLQWNINPPHAQKGAWIFTLFGQYVSRQYIDNTGDVKASIDPYFLSEARLSWRTTWPTDRLSFGESPQDKARQIELFVQINNLFNTLYETNAWVYKNISLDTSSKNYLLGYYPQATRHFFVGAKLHVGQ